MSPSHPIRCRCGEVRGRLDRSGWTNRLVCYCADCQAFAEHLGHAERTLDARGGSDIVQTGSRFVRFTQGADRLACLRLTPRGLLRWYAACCRTPIGNTPADHRIPFVGLLHDALDGADGPDPDATEGGALDAAFGPPRMFVFTRSAHGEPPPRSVISVPAIAAMMGRMATARLTGRYRDTPFFDGSGAPVAVPEVIG